MLTIVPLLLLACGPAAPVDPADANGTVLYARDKVLVVQHDDPLGRITVGVARYATNSDLELEPGQQVDLWLSGESRPRTVDRSEVTGTASLPGKFKLGGYDVTGTVVRVDGGKLTLDHAPIDGLMDAMVMPFDAGPDVAPGFSAGDTVRAKLIVSSHGYRLVEVEKTGEATVELRTDVKSLALGEVLPALEVPVSQGGNWVVGAGQPKPTAVTFIYTRCPDPNFCPAIVSRMGGLQERIGDKARILLVTIDPDYDHLPVLGMYGGLVGAKPETWSFGRLEPIELNQLALHAGLSVTVRGGRISHKLRMLVLDGDGQLIERYDDNEWPLDRVASQLLDGQPRDATELGSLYGEPE
ncbi:MAG: copper-binding protein [Proteobacteria bacterium]|nr:copper-binding protein [Pseudomonadota bacterium]